MKFSNLSLISKGTKLCVLQYEVTLPIGHGHGHGHSYGHGHGHTYGHVHSHVHGHSHGLKVKGWFFFEFILFDN